MGEKRKAFLMGMASAFLAWTVLTIADAIDELIIDVDMALGAIVFFGIPVVGLIFYIRHFLKIKPDWKRLILWFLGYGITFTVMWIVIFNACNRREFFIPQKSRGFILDLNGIEYMFYGSSALVAFYILCVVFHIVYVIVKLVRKKST